MKIFTAIIT